MRAASSDRGGEYLSNFLESRFKICGIKRELTGVYMPQQYGVAERQNHTLINLLRYMLQGKGLSKALRAEAVITTVYVKNQVTCRSMEDDTTPYHIWNGSGPALGHAPVFVSKCWYVLPIFHVQKLDSGTQTATFVGFYEGSRAYKL